MSSEQHDNTFRGSFWTYGSNSHDMQISYYIPEAGAFDGPADDCDDDDTDVTGAAGGVLVDLFHASTRYSNTDMIA